MNTRQRTLHMHPRALAALLLMLATLGTTAQADSGHMLNAQVPQAYTQECAACHVAFAPGMLPAASWRRVMTQLERHYGSDASLDAPTARSIESWLLTHAGTDRRVREEPPEDRITRTAWFERKHRKISVATWQLPSVKSAANCAACHTGADKGDFDDDRLRMPAGLSANQQRAWHD